MLAFNKQANRPDYMRVDLMREWLVDLGDVGDDEEEKHLKVRCKPCAGWSIWPNSWVGFGSTIYLYHQF